MARDQGKVGEAKSETIHNLPLACSSELAAVEFLEELRWGDTPACPKCGSTDVYKMAARGGQREAHFRWRCRDCKTGAQFSVRTATVLEDSRIPFRHWCWAFWQLCSSKKGMSAKQIQRQTGLSYKSALFLLHRVRFAMADMQGVKFTGTVEVDETYVGGKPRYKGQSKRGRGTNKTPVFGVVQRDGKIHRRVVADVTAATLKGAIRECVDNQARIISDEHAAYSGIGLEFAGGHETVNHGAKEYARGDVHTNTAESSFAIVKRGMYGVYHNVSKTHLHRYLAEFDFRWNHRAVDDGARTVAAIRGAEGKRLMYREPSGLST